MISQTIDVDFIPSGVNSIKHVHLNQYDVIANGLIFRVWNGAERFTIPTGSNAVIQGTKPDGHGFSYTCKITNNTVVANVTLQMTAVYGLVKTEIRVRSSSGDDIGVCNFYLDVEEGGLAENTDISETEIPSIIDEARSHMLAAQNAASQAATSATNANTSATKAATSATQAATSAQNASNSATSATNSATSATNSATNASNYAKTSQSWAVGGTGTRSGENTNNSKYWSERSEESKEEAKKYSDMAATYSGVVVPDFRLDMDTLILYQTNATSTLQFKLDENIILKYDTI